MVGKTELYDAFGELIYAVSKADGFIQNEEVDKLQELLASHAWGKEIGWSFNYEREKKQDLQTAYDKALYTCKEFGPSPEYPKLLDILQQIAAASHGIDSDEARLINNFEAELRRKFRADLLEGKWMIKD